MVLRCFWEFDLSHSVWTWADRVISALDQTWLWMGACWNHPETCNTTQEWWEARSNPDVWFQLISTDFNLSQTSKNQPTSNIHQTANRNNFKPPQGHQAALDPGLCVFQVAAASCRKTHAPQGRTGDSTIQMNPAADFCRGHWRAIEEPLKLRTDIRSILRCSRARASQFWLLSWSVTQADVASQPEKHAEVPMGQARN